MLKVSNMKLSFYKKVIYTVMSILFLTCIVEVLNGKGILQLYDWGVSNPKVFLLNVSISLLVILFFYSFFGRILIGFGCSAFVILILSMCNKFKQLYLSEPFLPSDLVHATHVFDLLSFLYIKNVELYFGISMGAILVVALFFVYKNKKVMNEKIIKILNKTKIEIKTNTRKFLLALILRLSIMAISFIVLLNISINSNVIYGTLKSIGVDDIYWHQNTSYNQNGFLVAFCINIKNIIITEPEGYCEEVVKKLSVYSDNKNKQNEKSIDNKSSKNPNIIVVMNEAFWDPKLLPNVQFSKNPMENFDSYKEKYTTGYVLSPTFGGKTANVEFEVLTGFSTKFLPQGSIPYQQHINRNIPNLVSLLNKNDYQAFGIHTYKKNFFDRDRVYKHLGFEKFIGEEDFINPKKKGLYIADEEITNKIFEVYEKKDKDKSLFVYGVSMQNHGPYSGDRYKQNFDIDVNSKKLSKEGLSILRTYTQGIYDADIELKKLVDYFNKKSEPTIIAFFGDHLPMLGVSYKVYKESGFINSYDTPEERKKMHSTPLLIWSNYGLEKENINTIGANMLAQYILNLTNIDKGAYFNVLEDGFKEVAAYTRAVVIDKEENIYSQSSNRLNEIEKRNWLLQYDLLFGQKFLELK